MTNAINEMGVAHCRAGRLAEGLACFHRAVRQEPQNVECHLNLGRVLVQLRRYDEAVAALGEAHALAPDKLEIHRLMARAYDGLGRAGELVSRYREAVGNRPGDAVLQRNAAAVLVQLGRRDDALALIRAAARAMPDDEETAILAASILAAAEALEEAEQVLIALLQAAPRNAEAGYQLGLIRSRRGLNDAAAETFEMVLRLQPNHIDALHRLADMRLAAGEVSESIQLYRRVMAAQPKSAKARSEYATALGHRGSVAAAVENYRAALDLAPDNRDLLSQYCFLHSLLPSATCDDIFAAHRQWGERHGTFPRPSYANGRDPERKLKIGYVSPDFREHSVSYFIAPVLEAHDRSRFEIACYASGTLSDAETARFQAMADRWRNIGPLSDEEAFRLIRDDGIDILVDLAGHSAGNRLALFGRAPAPVQITWLGYPETTGVPAIAYKLTDAIASPPALDRYASEKLLRLPNGFHCYRPPSVSPDVEPAPCLKNGYVTFGHFTYAPKLNPELIGVWCAVMRAVPDSRLVLKARSFADEAVRDRFAAMFGAGGVGAERITMLGFEPSKAGHLAQYGLMDLCLDTFPYSGTTTLAEALWMGVPVVTRVGDNAASRVGGSVLTEVGLAELVTTDADEFVRVAADLARDFPRLAALRSGMRARLLASPLRDEPGFARKIEGVYRDVWRRWCEA